MNKNDVIDKSFLTYNQQMRKLRDDKKIICNGSLDKRTLIRSGYFNIINGYKTPWYDTSAYSEKCTLQNKMDTISKAYNELSRSHLDYVKFYMDNHKRIPTWIMLKVVNFSTFIDVLRYSKKSVRHSICNLYEILDNKGLPNVKLLIGSLHWMRIVRNSCAHNERIYCITRKESRNCQSGRIFEKYLKSLRQSYSRTRDQKVFDLIVYFKYYLPHQEFIQLISELKCIIYELKSSISNQAFENIRGSMGIKNLDDIDTLIGFSKDEIDYNKFDKC
ncbi:MAG: Abi family protein [Anaerostipes sp.]|nr:Abi family protein [Anaerostipes sp.]